METEVLIMIENSYTNIYGMPPNPSCITRSMVDLHDEWRMLWLQHVAKTRSTIFSAAYNSPDFQATAAKLLQNATDMGAALKPVYGDAVAAGFAKLIRDHLLIAINLVSAAKKGDTAAAAQIEKEWYANADDIAAFMAGINPYWPQQAVKDMLYTHLALTKAEAVAILTSDFAKSESVYDEIERQALGMADAISDGIVRQAPWLFP
jgi:hypothetical protein